MKAEPASCLYLLLSVFKNLRLCGPIHSFMPPVLMGLITRCCCRHWEPSSGQDRAPALREGAFLLVGGDRQQTDSK